MNSNGSGCNTIFLRLEGPLQSWGDTSKFVMRRTMEAPTKSGIIGLICCAMGRDRQYVVQEPIPGEELRPLASRLVEQRKENANEPRRALVDLLNTLCMGVRVDRTGVHWWDYHSVGAAIGMTTAAGGVKTEAQGTVIKRLEYLADASFLVALQGDPALIDTVAAALASPKWALYLGRKSCPPSVPLLCRPRDGESWTNPMFVGDGLDKALSVVPWHPRHAGEEPPGKGKLPCVIEWRKSDSQPTAPHDAEVWYDVPYSFDPPAHHARFVVRGELKAVVLAKSDPLQHVCPPPARPRANYSDAAWTSESLVEVKDEKTGKVMMEPKGMRPRRLRRDQGLCVFCKQPATTVQHVTYRHAGGGERIEELRSLCRLCHDAVTMIEYGLGMGLDRINPEDPQYRDRIIQKRKEIIEFRSLETRRQRLKPKEVE